MPQLGAYFLADDGILDMAIAFLNSFRTYNASIPLCLIPYSDDFEQLTSLRRQYNFTIWRDVAALQWCDEISRLFHGCAVGQYRKLAKWGGSFDRFVYIDSDSVVLNNIDFALRYLELSIFSPRIQTCLKSAAGSGRTRFVLLAPSPKDRSPTLPTRVSLPHDASVYRAHKFWRGCPAR